MSSVRGAGEPLFSDVERGAAKEMNHEEEAKEDALDVGAAPVEERARPTQDVEHQSISARGADGDRCRLIMLWIIVVLLLGCLVASYCHKTFIWAVLAAWSFIICFPLLHLLITRARGMQEMEEQIKYKLEGNVVAEGQKERLSGDELRKIELWYQKHKDMKWYGEGQFTFLSLIAKAVLNMYSVSSSIFNYDPLASRDNPNYFGSSCVIAIEVPYTVFLFMYLLFTALRLCASSDQASMSDKASTIVRFAGLLKSLGRFSALNLLEFVCMDDFIHQDRMQKLMSLVSSVFGFMAFRCKILGISSASLNHHMYEWNVWQWIGILAVVNNLLSIIDRKQFMIANALKSKQYRTLPWLQAVAEHLVTEVTNPLEAIYTFNGDMGIICSDDGIVKKVIGNSPAFVQGIRKGHKLVTVGSSEFSIEGLTTAQASRSDYDVMVRLHAQSLDDLTWRQKHRVVRRLVSIGPGDVNRLIDDLSIEVQGSSRLRSRRPKEISLDFQLTNIVGVLHKVFDRILTPEEAIVCQTQQTPQKGEVAMKVATKKETVLIKSAIFEQVKEENARVTKRDKEEIARLNAEVKKLRDTITKLNNDLILATEVKPQH